MKKGHSVNKSTGQTKGDCMKVSDENYRIFFDNSLVTLFVFNENGNIIKANKEACRVLKYTEDEFTKLTVEDIHPAELIAETRKSFEEIIAGKRKVCTIPFVASDGAIIPVETSIEKAVWNQQPAFFCASRDMTELKRSEERFYNAFYNSGIASALVSIHDNSIVDMNEKLADFLSLTKDEMLGKKVHTIFRNTNFDFSSVAVKIKKHNNIENKTISFRNDSGRELYFLLNVVYINSSINDCYIISLIEITGQIEAEKRLVESKVNFESFFDNSINILFVFNEFGQIQKANKEALVTLEYTEKELQKLTVLDIHPAPMRAATKKALQEITSGKRDYCTIPLVSKSGKIIPVDTNVGKGIWDGKNAFYCVSKDLTELRISEEKFAKAFQFSSNAMIISTLAELSVIEVNERYTEIFGYSAEEVIGVDGLGVDFYLNEKEKNKLVNGDRREFSLFDGCRIKVKDGSIKYLNISISKIDFLGIDYGLISAQDITEQKMAEMLLKENETQLREITENVQEGIALADLNLKYVFVNNTYTQLSGYSKQELMKMKITDMLIDEYDHEMPEKLKNEGDTVARRNVRLRRKDGAKLIADISAKRIRIGKEEFILGSHKDITERYKAEQKLVEAYDEIKTLKSKLEEENLILKEEIQKTKNYSGIITENINFQSILQQVEVVANTNANVLIHGETGTGKELVASALHQLSDRRKKPMIKLNCAAIPESLIESELFGHEKGAFTGALNQKLGRFELADGGTLFLDEIGEMPLNLQSKLLRVLQEGEFERVGGVKTIHVNVRIVSATNRDLLQEVNENRFRQDLYYRLNVVPIKIPALRERIDDIAVLTNHFVGIFNKKFGKNIRRIPVTIMNRLINYHWPGNVRELENLLERSVLLSKGDTLSLSGWEKNLDDKISKQDAIVTLEEMQKNYIVKVLKQTNWKISGENGAAELLGMKRSTLTSKMQKLGISKANGLK